MSEETIQMPTKMDEETRNLIYECYEAFEEGYATWPDDMWLALVAKQKGESPPLFLKQFRLDQDCGNDF